MTKRTQIRKKDWDKLIYELTQRIGHIEADELAAYGIEASVGACTRAYIDRDIGAWAWHELYINMMLERAESAPPVLPKTFN